MPHFSLGWRRISSLTILYWIAILLAWAGWASYRAQQAADAILRTHPEYANHPIGVLSPVGFSWPIAIGLVIIPPAVLIYLQLRPQRTGDAPGTCLRNGKRN